LDGVLEQVLAGTYDPVKQAAIAAKQNKMEQELMQALTGKQFDKALQLADELAKHSPQLANDIIGLKFQILLEKKDYEAAYKVGGQLFEIFKDEPETLSSIAWTIAAEESIEKRDLALAEKMILRAVELTKGEVPPVLDTAATVYDAKGDYAKAVEWQTKAVAKSSDDEEKKELQEALEEYKAKLNKK
jgi:tetratricopeptide (TPR) repeat protein